MFNAVLKRNGIHFVTDVYVEGKLYKKYNKPMSKEDIETFLRVEMLNRHLSRGELTFSVEFEERHDTRLFVLDFDKKIFENYDLHAPQN